MVDDDGGGGVGEFDRFTKGGAGTKGDQEVGADCVASTDDVDFTAEWKGRGVLYRTIRARAHNAAFGESNKYWLRSTTSETRSGAFDFVRAAGRSDVFEHGEFRGIHFENDRRKIAQASPAVGENS